MDDVYGILMGMKDRSGIEKAKLANMLYGQTSYGSDAWTELNRLWNGEEFDSVRINELMSTVMNGYDRMARVQESNSRATQEASRNSLTSSDLTEFRGLPAAVAAAVESGMAKVKIYIDGQSAGQVLTPYIGGTMGKKILAMTR